MADRKVVLQYCKRFPKIEVKKPVAKAKPAPSNIIDENRAARVMAYAATASRAEHRELAMDTLYDVAPARSQAAIDRDRTIMAKEVIAQQ